MQKLCKKYNINLLRKHDTSKRDCNCCSKNTCLLGRKCLSSNFVYSAEVLVGNNQQGDKYFGICETEFKSRLGKNKNSLENRQKEKGTELSKYTWRQKHHEL